MKFFNTTRIEFDLEIPVTDTEEHYTRVVSHPLVLLEIALKERFDCVDLGYTNSVTCATEEIGEHVEYLYECIDMFKEDIQYFADRYADDIQHDKEL